MGLAGPTNKVKIGVDPNNNSWSRDTSRFGHKHLCDLGWKPGQGLGASASGRIHHIKVQNREEGVGLGKTLKPDKPTGLDAFQQLLGRLNGNEQEVVQKIEEKNKRLSGLYSNFVYAGTLEHSIKGSDEHPASASDRKRKRRESESQAEAARLEAKKLVKEEKTKSKDKKDKKCKKEAEKLEKKKLKEAKKLAKVAAKLEKKSKPEPSPEAEPARKPMGIRATRNRYIAMKRQATADEKSLKEIFMMK